MRDHPVIEWCERTGYPQWNQPKSCYCQNCGECLDNKEVYADRAYEFLCKECLLILHEKQWW